MLASIITSTGQGYRGALEPLDGDQQTTRTGRQFLAVQLALGFVSLSRTSQRPSSPRVAPPRTNCANMPGQRNKIKRRRGCLRCRRPLPHAGAPRGRFPMRSWSCMAVAVDERTVTPSSPGGLLSIGKPGIRGRCRAGPVTELPLVHQEPGRRTPPYLPCAPTGARSPAHRAALRRSLCVAIHLPQRRQNNSIPRHTIAGPFSAPCEAAASNTVNAAATPVTCRFMG